MTRVHSRATQPLDSLPEPCTSSLSLLLSHTLRLPAMDFREQYLCHSGSPFVAAPDCGLLLAETGELPTRAGLRASPWVAGHLPFLLRVLRLGSRLRCGGEFCGLFLALDEVMAGPRRRNIRESSDIRPSAGGFSRPRASGNPPRVPRKSPGISRRRLRG